MSNQCETYLQAFDLQIEEKHLLKSPFYLAWSKGELSIECLREYAKEYYHHVSAFPTYLSALHSRTENQTVRQALLQNLIEEEAGSPNHPELWRNFAFALGVTEEELQNHKPSKEMEALVSTFRKICQNQTLAEGIAALYGYESQIPKICISKIEGLKKFYGMQNPRNWEYFSVHIAADEEHAAQERQLLGNHVNETNKDQVSRALSEVLDSLWNFLDVLGHRYNIAAAC